MLPFLMRYHSTPRGRLYEERKSGKQNEGQKKEAGRANRQELHPPQGTRLKKQTGPEFLGGSSPICCLREEN